jgi:hypothetical protein
MMSGSTDIGMPAGGPYLKDAHGELETRFDIVLDRF